jgi:hypothetical protein
MRKHNSNHRKRGRPEEPIEVEVKFIQSGEGIRRWTAIFTLLEAEDSEAINSLAAESNDSDSEQLRLF